MIFLNVRPKSTACLLISTNMQSTNLHAIRLHDNYITDSMSQLQLPTRIATPSQLQTGFLWSKSHIQLLGTDNGRSSMQNPGSKKPRCPLSSAPYLLFFFFHISFTQHLVYHGHQTSCVIHSLPGRGLLRVKESFLS